MVEKDVVETRHVPRVTRDEECASHHPSRRHIVAPTTIRRFDDSTASMESWATRARDAVASRDGIALTACVSARAIVGGGECDDDGDGAEAIERRACARVRGLGGAREGSWDEALGAFYAAAVCGARAAVEAADAHARGVKAFVKAFRADDDGAWATPAVYACVDDARAFAERADEDLKRRGEKPSKLADVGSTLMLAYRAVSQTSSREKKAPQLHVVNALFKVYFKLNALHLCKNLINAVNLPTFLPFDSFPKSEKVTYNFYVGRLAVFEDAYERAAAHLEYAFENCHARSRKNVRLILQYLIPVKLILGVLPSERLLQTYELREFVDVVEAARRGDVRLLNAALHANESTFIKQGTYLILEKLRMSVYRTLFKKIHAIHGERETNKANQVALVKFQRALRWCGVDDVDIDEVECVVSNLIFRKFVKGYISHKNRVVVLSKADPFPPLKTVFAD